MTSTAASPSAPAPAGARPFSSRLRDFARSVDKDLVTFLAAKRLAAQELLGPSRDAVDGPVALIDALGELVEGGGKRLRPALIHHSYLACGGTDVVGVRPLELAAELLHAYLLIHDDIMDHAETRRGRQAAHARFRDRHADAGWRGDAADYGQSMGILAGDLAASYAFELFARAATATGAPSAAMWSGVRNAFTTMSQEVILGQYLEIDLSYAEEASEEQLLQVLRLKSGRYSVERPVELGALAAGADEPEARQQLLEPLRRYGAALGEVFQLQDDLLGMFGEVEAVGKPVGGDLAEGKLTFLLHHGLAAADGDDRAFLARVRGRGHLSAAEAQRAVEILEASGARRRVEEMIEQRLDVARRSLAELPTPAEGPRQEGLSFLAGLIDFSQERQR